MRFSPLGQDRFRAYSEIFLDDEHIGLEKVCYPSKPFHFDEDAQALVPNMPSYHYYDCEHWHYEGEPQWASASPYDSIVHEDECTHPETKEVVSGWHGAYNSLDRLLHYVNDIDVVYECQPGDTIATPRGEGRFVHFEFYPPVQPHVDKGNTIKILQHHELPEWFMKENWIRVAVEGLPPEAGAPDPAYFPLHEVINSSAAERLLETASDDGPE